MKNSIVFLLFTLTLCFVKVQAQDVRTGSKGSILPYRIGVPYHKTVNLVFPYSIRNVDRGSAGVLVQKAPGVENVLQVKAAEEDFTETNLSVITGEGALYSFLLSYNDNPGQLNIKVSEISVPVESFVQFSEATDNESEYRDIAKKISTKQKTISGCKDKKYDISMDLQGIYVQDDILYFQIAMENSSGIRYDVDQFRMYIRDKKSTKRTASQELELAPIYIDGNMDFIEGRSQQKAVIAVNKFTIPDKKILRIQLMEKNGGRNLELKLSNKTIIKAKLP